MVELRRDLLQGVRPLAVGISFGGPASNRRGEVILSHHVPGWEGFPIVARVGSEFGAPAVVENDANIAALGDDALL
jgi:glucokinase